MSSLQALDSCNIKFTVFITDMNIHFHFKDEILMLHCARKYMQSTYFSADIQQDAYIVAKIYGSNQKCKSIKYCNIVYSKADLLCLLVACFSVKTLRQYPDIDECYGCYDIFSLDGSDCDSSQQDGWTPDPDGVLDQQSYSSESSSSEDTAECDDERLVFMLDENYQQHIAEFNEKNWKQTQQYNGCQCENLLCWCTDNVQQQYIKDAINILESKGIPPILYDDVCGDDELSLQHPNFDNQFNKIIKQGFFCSNCNDGVSDFALIKQVTKQ